MFSDDIFGESPAGDSKMVNSLTLHIIFFLSAVQFSPTNSDFDVTAFFTWSLFLDDWFGCISWFLASAFSIVVNMD